MSDEQDAELIAHVRSLLKPIRGKPLDLVFGPALALNEQLLALEYAFDSAKSFSNPDDLRELVYNWLQIVRITETTANRLKLSGMFIPDDSKGRLAVIRRNFESLSAALESE